MNEKIIEEINKRHIELHNAFINKFNDIKDNKTKFEDFIKKTNDLLDDIVNNSSQVRSIEDYQLLNSIANEWRVIYTTILNIPRNIKLSAPEYELKSRKGIYSEDEIINIFSDISYKRSEKRKWERIISQIQSIISSVDKSTKEECDHDWYNASVDFASQILSGKIDFTVQIRPESYFHLQSVWLDQIKKLEAYYNWEKKGNNIDNGVEEYYQACSQINNMLTISAAKEYFSEAKTYIEEHYLSNGKLDLIKPDVKKLIEIKAKHLSEKNKNNDEKYNWFFAERYIKMFYENIITAVTKDNFENTLIVLKAIQYCVIPNDLHPIVDAFEVALVIYFLNDETIKEIWKESYGKELPEFPYINKVDLYPGIDIDVPKEFQDQLKIDHINKKLIFEGVMTEEQKYELNNHFKKNEQREMINRLFEISRILPKEKTI